MPVNCQKQKTFLTLWKMEITHPNTNCFQRENIKTEKSLIKTFFYLDLLSLRFSNGIIFRLLGHHCCVENQIEGKKNFIEIRLCTFFLQFNHNEIITRRTEVFHKKKTEYQKKKKSNHIFSPLNFRNAEKIKSLKKNVCALVVEIFKLWFVVRSQKSQFKTRPSRI